MPNSWLSPERLLMIGVVGIGAYALYRLTRASPEAEPAPPGDAGRPRPLEQLPILASPAAPPAGAAVIFGNPVHLSNSRAYQGRLETIDTEGRARGTPFAPTSTREEISQAITSLGFDAVRVFMTPTEATGYGFAPYAVTGAGRGTRWFYGRYTGPTRDAPRPPALALLWIVKGPRTAGAIAATLRPALVAAPSPPPGTVRSLDDPRVAWLFSTPSVRA